MHLTVAWFAVADLDSARRFYSETLEMPVSFEMPGWVEFGGGEGRAAIALCQMPPGQLFPGARPVLQVPNLDDSIATLRQRGVRFLGDIETIPGVIRLISMEDACGNILQMVQLLMEPQG
jgi:predicted enzyme related to lactoylglutathione lyase